jgi:hypothetical protein
MVRTCRKHGEEFIQGFGGKTRQKELLGRHRHRWEHNIKINLRAIESEYRLDSSASG